MDRNLSHVLLSEQMRIREKMSKLPILGQYFHPVGTQENIESFGTQQSCPWRQKGKEHHV